MPETTQATTNQANYLFKWIMSGLASLVTIGGMAWAQTMYTETTEIKETLSARGERLTRLETQYESMSKQLNRIDNIIENNSKKLDKLIEGK